MKSFFALLGFGLMAVLLPAQSAQEQITVIESDQLYVRNVDTESTAVFTDKVVLTATNLKITCERLEVVFTRKGDPTATIGKFDNFKSLLATGNVRIIQGDREAACGRAEVLPGDEKIILTGRPVVVDHTSKVTFTGDTLEMLRGQRQLRGTHINMTGPSIRDLGVDKPKTAEPAPAAEAPKQP